MGNYSHFYVGTYTRPILFGTGEILEGKGEGIYLLTLDRDSGRPVSCELKGKTDNPSYLCLDRTGKYLYAVNELKEYAGKSTGLVTAFAVEGNRVLRQLNRMETKGQDPCHLALSPDENILSVANFMTGSVCVYQVDGELKREIAFFQHEGSGSNPTRQKGPHAHSCIFMKGSCDMAVPDLGNDRLTMYRFDGEEVKAVPEEDYLCQPGNGPRYGEYQPENGRFYLINELASSVTVLHRDPDTRVWTALQTISTVQMPCGNNICADLHLSPDGRFLYASNRGADSIAVYSVDLESGLLTWLREVDCGGKTPRNFVIDRQGEFLLVGNQDSDAIVVFRIHRESGSLEESGRIYAPTPVCIVQDV